MLNEVVAVTVRLLRFRAGPQDFPFAPQLVVPVPAAFAGVTFVVLVVEMPPGIAALLTLVNVAVLALVTHWLLGVRRLGNRFQQTFHSLLTTGTVLSLLSVPPLIALAPTFKQIAADPELLKVPGAIQIPLVPFLLIGGLNIWLLAVYGHIYRHAAGTRLSIGLLIALFAGLILTVTVQALLAVVGP